MRITTMIIAPIILLNSCTSKKKVSIVTERSMATQNFKDSVVSRENEQRSITREQNEATQNFKDYEDEVNINGTSDTTNSFIFHNIIGGDTLASIRIKGNATFNIRTRNTQRNTHEANAVKFDNVIQQVAHEVTSEETIKNTAETIKNTAKVVKKNNFSLATYIWAGGGLLVAIIAILLYHFKGRFIF